MRSLLLLALLLPAFVLADEAEKEFTIIASIRPLALIAQDVAGDLASIETLLPSGASHHDYSMRISDRRRLDAADLVLWMGPAMERFLERPLRTLDPSRVLTLGQNTQTQPDRHHDHSHAVDLHQWLDPRLAAGMAEAIGARLQQLLPQHRLLVEQRVREVLAHYEALHRELQTILAPVQTVGFVVEHRGYDLLVATYGLHQIGWISEHSDQPPSVRHIYQLEQQIRQQPEGEQARCLFNERAHKSQAVANLAAQLGLRLRSLDILGDEADTYAALMRHLAEDMADCLQAT